MPACMLQLSALLTLGAGGDLDEQVVFKVGVIPGNC